MFRRSDSFTSYSHSFRKRRNRTRWLLAFVCFAGLLLVFVGTGLLLGSGSQKTIRAPIAPIPTAPALSLPTSTALPTQPALVNLAALTPVALSPQKWNWPINIYSPDVFKKGWQYTDSPIAEGRANRGWAYGEAPLGRFLEQYKDSPQGLRLVEYWDKARLEINNPSKSAAAADYVNNAPLVREMLSGEALVGDKLNLILSPAKIPLAGDPADASNPSLTYAALAPLASLKNNNRAEKQLEATVTATLDKGGRAIKDPLFARYEVKQSFYIEDTGHNIPNVFWDFLNRSGIVNQDGKFQMGRLYDWNAMAGLPLTEAYWTRTTVDGKTTDVLVQAFERRTLVFTPSNPAGMQVEWGNAGKQYLHWRYPASGLAAPTGVKLPDGTAALPGQAVQNNLLTPGASLNSKVQDTLEIRLALGNQTLERTLNIQNGRVTNTSLTNRASGRVYTSYDGLGVNGGLLLKLEGPNATAAVVSGEQFQITGYSMPVWTDSEKQISLAAFSNFQGQTLNVKFNWRVFAGRNYIEKWVVVDSNPALAGWRVRFATIEDLPLTEGLKAAPPTPDEENLPILVPSERNPIVAGGAIFTNVMVHDDQREGLFFFSATPLGGEYALDKRVVAFQEEYQDLKNGFTSGKAVLGTYTGPVDLGFKRYTEYLQNFYTMMAGKRQPIWYSTWYPFTNEINQDLLMQQLDLMKPMGIYDLLHIDAGWESTYPLDIDLKKFPNGFKPLMDKGAEANIRLGIWINPFSNSYEQYVSYAGLHRDHPEWHIKDMDHRDDKKGYNVGPFGINTDYYFYVHDKLINLVKTYNIKAIYWDGADWNIPDASAPGLSDEQRSTARVQGLKRLMALMDDLHKAVPDLIVVAWNSTADVHLLGSVEQLQLSDIWELPVGESELFRLQQFYASTYHLPYYSIWSDWYSITYKENKDDNLKLPLDQLKYMETKMVGAGGNIAGASLDLSKVPPDLLNHIKKLYIWRKKFEKYFTGYQHILNEPDRDNLEITGEGHVIDGVGFILLNNPTDRPLEVNLPLSAPELELDPSQKYRLFDWSNFESGQPLGDASPGEGVPLIIGPHSVRIIGLNLPTATPATSGQ